MRLSCSNTHFKIDAQYLIPFLLTYVPETKVYKMTARTTCNSLQVATPLYRFIEDKVLPGTGIKSADFWKGFDELVKDLTPKNEALLAKRDRIQLDLDKWHQANPGPIKDMPAYRKFLKEIELQKRVQFLEAVRTE